MRLALTAFVLAVAPCIGPAQAGTDSVQVRVVDNKRQPIPGAVVWALPGKAWERLRWIPNELRPWCGNPYAMLRQLGERSEADAFGIVSVPRGSILAGEHGDLAGVTELGEDSQAPCRLQLDDWRWTVLVRDQGGRSVAGVPIACMALTDLPELEFEGLPLGLTDADGRLVVRAPGSVNVAKYIGRPIDGPEPPAPEFVRFEVDGMYLASHAERLSLEVGASGIVTLTMPPVTRVEIRLPEWNGPIAESVFLTRTGHDFLDETSGYMAKGRRFALVGAPDRSDLVRMDVWIDGSTIRKGVEVPRLPPDQTFPIQLELDQDDIVVRACVHDASGRPAALAVLQVTPTSDSLRTWFAHADRAGRFALVLRPGLPAETELRLQVHASPDPRLLDVTALLKLGQLRAGDRRDVGILKLTAK